MVSVLSATPMRRSSPTLASVRVSSVVSGLMSLTERTIVVFPVPNPPAIITFTERVPPPAENPGRSKPLESTEYLLKEREVGPATGAVRRDGVAGFDAVCLQQVRQQHRENVEGQSEVGTEFGHRQRPAAAPEDLLVLVLHARDGRGAGDDEGRHVKARRRAARSAASPVRT